MLGYGWGDSPIMLLVLDGMARALGAAGSSARRIPELAVKVELKPA